MKLTIDIPDEKIEAFLKSVMQNMPEYSLSMTCVFWKYDEMVFKFIDFEDDHKEYVVTLKDLKKGFEKMAKDMFEEDKLAGYRKQLGDDWMDDCNWDAGILDCLVQYAIFGEERYC
jgi:hypothetical protein